MEKEKKITTMKQKVKTFYVKHKETILVATLLGGSTLFYKLTLDKERAEMTKLKKRPVVEVGYVPSDPSRFYAAIGKVYIGDGEAMITQPELKDKHGIIPTED